MNDLKGHCIWPIASKRPCWREHRKRRAAMPRPTQQYIMAQMSEEQEAGLMRDRALTK